MPKDRRTREDRRSHDRPARDQRTPGASPKRRPNEHLEDLQADDVFEHPRSMSRRLRG